MTIKKRITGILSIIFLFFLPCFLTWCSANPSPDPANFYNFLSPAKEQSKTGNAIVKQLQHGHYVRLALNDNLSTKMFDRYLSDLDPARSYFLASDIREFEAYRYQLDDALKAGDLDIAFKIYNRFEQRVTDRLVFLISRIEQGLQGLKFDIDESLVTDRKNAPWPDSVAALDELWRKRLKSNVLNLKLSDKSLEEITGILEKRYRSQLKRTMQVNSEDAFQTYINSFTETHDPHTQYFSPRATENFNIHMSLSLEGIGAILQQENEYTKVVRLVAAGPADKAKQLKPGDRIVGVGQGHDGEIVDVVGWRLDDVVQLIRGPKQTTVRLEVIPEDADDEHQTKTIKIVRDTVRLEEQSARKKVMELSRKDHTFKIGIIDIPTFYLDFKALQQGDPDFKSTTRDVKRLLQELSETGVDGIIIDLRDNSGGSLQEVHTLTGLFIRQGPVVQVRNANGTVNILLDQDPEILYSGPLAVVVNRLSASASEIFAGAIQDYGRGIIIGGPTFGKGTVQTLIPLNRGQLKTTMAKFYRITGESTQRKGVVPDIFYPDLYDKDEIGESALPQALPWDKIGPAPYRACAELTQVVAKLRELHRSRIKQDPDYIYILKMIEHRERLRKKTQISLKEAFRRKETESTKQWRLDLENKRRIAKHLEPLAKFSDLEAEKEKKPDDQSPEDDPLLIESGQVLIDFMSLFTGNDLPAAQNR